MKFFEINSDLVPRRWNGAARCFLSLWVCCLLTAVAWGHEPQHAPALGGGPVLKHNANQSYATDAMTESWFAGCAASVGVPVQHFVTRADLPCGSTIGPLTATRLGLATVDVGSPMLSMHSCRELASMDDVPLMVAAMTACLS